MSDTKLFTVKSPDFVLTWSAKRLSATMHESLWRPPGRLALRSLSAGEPAEIDRRVAIADLAAEVASRDNLGPRLEEETDYLVYLRPLSKRSVSLHHADPTVMARINREDDGVSHGAVNFRSNVGLSDLDINVDGRPHTRLTMEVYPTKLDYRSDYEGILADIQDIATALALEYLRSTYRLGRVDRGEAGTTDLEWTLLLRHVFDDLERGLHHVAREPQRQIVREDRLVPVHELRRVDRTARRSVRQLRGSGPLVDAGHGVKARANVWSRPAKPTLDTPEHRWLSHQVTRMRQRLARLADVLSRGQEDLSKRRLAQLEEVHNLERRAARLSRLEPLIAAEGVPPSGFTSQQLMAAPGYREAYQSCLILNAGLNLEGDALRTSTKQLHRLYEYWCYLTIVRLLGQLTEAPLDPAELFEVRSSGLSVSLQQGHQTQVTFEDQRRTIRVRYNPGFSSDHLILVPQRPDILITLERQGWPALHLVVDAKYRVDQSDEYVNRHDAPGPPEDALNALHRYRDAILEEYDDEPARHIVKAAAMFPGRDRAGVDYTTARLRRSLERLGVGALPALPDATGHVHGWLRDLLELGGFELSESAVPHAAHQHLVVLRTQEAQRVLLKQVTEIELRDFRIAGELQVDDDEATRAEFIGLTVHDNDSVQLILTPVTGRARAWGRHGADPSDSPRPPAPWLRLEVDFSQERKRTLNATPRAELDGAWTSVLATTLASSSEELLLSRLEDWKLHDALERRGVVTGVFRDYSELPTRPWLRTAAEQRARYEGADGYALGWEGEARRRFRDLQELLAAIE